MQINNLNNRLTASWGANGTVSPGNKKQVIQQPHLDSSQTVNRTNSSQGALNLASAAAVASSSSSSTSSLTAGLSTSGLGLSATLYGVSGILQRWGQMSWQSGTRNGAIAGAGIGTMIMPGVGTLVGAGIGAIVGRGLALINNRKHPDRLERDNLRRLMQYGPSPLLDQNFCLTLANGEKFNISGEGKNNMLQGGAYDGKRHLYDVNWDMPNVGEAVGLLDPLASFYARIGRQSKSDRTANIVGWLLNAASSSGDLLENISAFYIQSGLDRQSLEESIGADFTEGKIDQTIKDARLATVELLYGAADARESGREQGSDTL